MYITTYALLFDRSYRLSSQNPLLFPPTPGSCYPARPDNGTPVYLNDVVINTGGPHYLWISYLQIRLFTLAKFVYVRCQFSSQRRNFHLTIQYLRSKMTERIYREQQGKPVQMTHYLKLGLVKTVTETLTGVVVSALPASNILSWSDVSSRLSTSKTSADSSNDLTSSFLKGKKTKQASDYKMTLISIKFKLG